MPKANNKKPKTYWNHRVLAIPCKDEIVFAIHEVYYTEDKPDGATAKPKTVSSDSIESVKWILDRMKECLAKPILWGDERFPEEYKP